MIFGYRQLSINLFYLHNSAKCFVDLHSSGKIVNNELKPDDVMQALIPWLPQNYCTKKDDFLKEVKNEQHNHIFGKPFYEFKGERESMFIFV